MDYQADWSYLDPERAERLHQCPRFWELIHRFVVAINQPQNGIGFRLDPGYLVPTCGAIRPLFYYTFSEDILADWFFNGVCGYRAQYYLSPANGLKANLCALAAVEKVLWRVADLNSFSYVHDGKELRMNPDDLLLSLRLPSAKIWGDETEGELQKVTAVNQNDEPQILAPRWLANARAGMENARKGVKAPRIKTIKFHGAFLRDSKEIIPFGKINRSEDIHSYGFS